MRTLLAFDKFKDALSAREACESAACALRETHPDWTLDLCPLTDGGDGFAEILGTTLGGERRTVVVHGPRGALVEAGVFLVPWKKIPAAALAFLALPHSEKVSPRTAHNPPAVAPPNDPIPLSSRRTLAIIDLASASGLALLPTDARDPRQTSTYGTGQLIRAAADLGAGAIVLGLGGSATHDLGCGALRALGNTFHAHSGETIAAPMPAHWPEIVQITPGTGARAHQPPEQPRPPTQDAPLPPLFLACDVTNPLLGAHGAAATFAPQKGLPLDQVAALDRASARMARLLCDAHRQPHALGDAPGAGAAGGTAFGLLCGANAKIVPGFGFVAACLDLPARIAAADIVVTGEGRFDATSSAGKGPGAIIHAARQRGKPVHVFAGRIDTPPPAPSDRVSLHPISPPTLPLAEALARAREFLTRAVRAL